MDFKDAVVVVTGGTRGIGRAISLAFALEGAHVFAGYLGNDTAAEELAGQAKALPGHITTVKGDVSTSSGAQTLIDAATRDHGRLDVLVNNAGIIRDCYLAMMSDYDWQSVIHTNLDPLFHCCKWGVRRMMAARSGAIINISSVSALVGAAGQANYAASKGAMLSFTKSLARETGRMGIRVNAIAAGLINTEMTAGLKQDVVAKIIASSALERIGQPEEVAAAVLFLASGKASFITGQTLTVDGGIA
ncbi:MAG TPA: 3-oxoacyl-ACP reductase family protein [Deltaproteobacteria bacterium]|nr:3-oxoacyl-ACP reductase family protein [Deltaproteobacteria bacterium]HQB37714.1 3-oxoacyl-ACP reductase family protein [Deltaproteobacteria bacterium]